MFYNRSEFWKKGRKEEREEVFFFPSSLLPFLPLLLNLAPGINHINAVKPRRRTAV